MRASLGLHFGRPTRNSLIEHQRGRHAQLSPTSISYCSTSLGIVEYRSSNSKTVQNDNSQQSHGLIFTPLESIDNLSGFGVDTTDRNAEMPVRIDKARLLIHESIGWLHHGRNNVRLMQAEPRCLHDPNHIPHQTLARLVVSKIILMAEDRLMGWRE